MPRFSYVNPFDQPMWKRRKSEPPVAAEYERAACSHPDTLSEVAAVGDYESARGSAYLRSLHSRMNQAHRNALDAIRLLVRDRKKVATTVGFGPRYLHSTGQAHKGGPNTGVFLLITCDDREDLPVPGQKYTFGTIKLAQARGDFEVLAGRAGVCSIHFSDLIRPSELHSVILISVTMMAPPNCTDKAVFSAKTRKAF